MEHVFACGSKLDFFASQFDVRLFLFFYSFSYVEESFDTFSKRGLVPEVKLTKDTLWPVAVGEQNV